MIGPRKQAANPADPPKAVGPAMGEAALMFVSSAFNAMKSSSLTPTLPAIVKSVTGPLRWMQSAGPRVPDRAGNPNEA